MSDLITPTARLLAPSGLPRDEWLDVRRQGIGGSDVAAILGMDKRRGPLHVYLDKRGELREERDAKLDRAARRGHRLEGLVAEFFAEETGRIVLNTPGTLQHAEHPWMLANPDRISFADSNFADPAVLECKSRTWRSARAEDWGGDEPPDGPALQAYWYRAVTGYGKAHVAGLVDDDFVHFELADDTELIGHLVTLVADFWRDHVEAGIPPEPGDLESTDELLGRLWDATADSFRLFNPEESKAADALLARRAEVVAERRALERELGAIENKLKARLGDAEIALAPGRELYSWKRNGNFAYKRFRQAYPDLAREYTRTAKAIDGERLAAEQPEIHRRFRARVFRVPGGTV
ncbi:endonuclease [Spongiactinospora rosea]|uniref:Endonuclease n=1 Tax=Spongiactinospora rosea TaxID=2248750 RepID=A0A366M5R6_9ACTN|nr:YqaJ viral recombinase family protein [Spongiactinospora rosea]RBQ21541.1 endonuclease [Spongiactinospora rosea]